MKNPSNYPIKSFALLNKITTHIFKKSVALIVITVRNPIFNPFKLSCGFAFI